jgi:hypothetical protein
MTSMNHVKCSRFEIFFSILQPSFNNLIVFFLNIYNSFFFVFEVENIYDLKIFESLRTIVMPFVDEEEYKKFKYDHKSLNIRFQEIWERIEKERYKNKDLIVELRKELKKLMGKGQKEDGYKRKSRNAELKVKI